MVKNKWILILTLVLSLILLTSAFGGNVIGMTKQNLKKSCNRGECCKTEGTEPVRQNLRECGGKKLDQFTVDRFRAEQNLRKGGARESDYEDIISLADVFDIYISKYPNTKVKEVEFEAEHGFYVYEIKGYDKNNKYELKIHPVSGKVLKEKIKGDKGSYGEISRKHLEKIPGLVTSAFEDAGKGALLHEWEVEFDDGRPELEIELKIREQNKKIKYEYDLEIGKLIEKKVKKIK